MQPSKGDKAIPLLQGQTCLCLGSVEQHLAEPPELAVASYLQGQEHQGCLSAVL